MSEEPKKYVFKARRGARSSGVSERLDELRDMHRSLLEAVRGGKTTSDSAAESKPAAAEAEKVTTEPVDQTPPEQAARHRKLGRRGDAKK